jgi:hypothetical protein
LVGGGSGGAGKRRKRMMMKKKERKMEKKGESGERVCEAVGGTLVQSKGKSLFVCASYCCCCCCY